MNSVLRKMLIILFIIALFGAGAFVLFYNQQETEGKNAPTIDEVLKMSVDVKQITTNLSDDSIIRISFKILTDSKEAKEELEKRDFQVRNIIILTLSEKKSGDLKGKTGQVKLEEELKEKFNGILQSGNVKKVYITESLLQ